jgi:hypothetical protein
MLKNLINILHFCFHLESNGDTASSSNSTSGVKLPRTKSVRFSDGYAPGKANQTLNENDATKNTGI